MLGKGVSILWKWSWISLRWSRGRSSMLWFPTLLTVNLRVWYTDNGIKGNVAVINIFKQWSEKHWGFFFKVQGIWGNSGNLRVLWLSVDLGLTQTRISPLENREFSLIIWAVFVLCKGQEEKYAYFKSFQFLTWLQKFVALNRKNFLF